MDALTRMALFPLSPLQLLHVHLEYIESADVTGRCNTTRPAECIWVNIDPKKKNVPTYGRQCHPLRGKSAYCGEGRL
ncbi:hypothetical protein C8R44DRAFT_803884, partial [Mycena epipterygia]